MKKNRPIHSPSVNQEELYAQVQKPRGQTQQTPQTGDSIYENVGFSGRAPHNAQRPDDVVYADVGFGGRAPHNAQRLDDVVYADVGFGGRTPHNAQRLDDVVYADVGFGGRAPHNAQRLDDVVYADVGFGGRAPHNAQRPDDVVYADVNRGGHRRQHPEAGETEYATVSPHQRGAHSLSSEEITKRTERNERVKAFREEVQYWCKNTYGDPNLLNGKMDDILRNPENGTRLAQDIAENPKSVHKLAGRSVFGIKSNDRKHAEESVHPLSEAVKGYTDSVKNTKERLQHNLGAEERRHAYGRHDEYSRQYQRERHQHTRQQETQQHRHERQGQGMAFAM
ncbi:hypothetical protein ABID23_000668 [Bartonella silvatica]|uniref:Uncharacterized protein n=1 Tax=Bartonella silvatica TaxID=357760 RepID=A0ABV2HGK6_9HYPH